MIKKLRKLYFVLLVVTMLMLTWPSMSQANGGTIIFPTGNEGGDVGAYNVTVTESPSPPSPDVNTHLTVLLTKAKSDAQVRNANIIFTPVMTDMAMPPPGSRRSFQGQQPDTYDVDLPLSMEGTWKVHLQIVAPGYPNADLDVNLQVEKPSAPWPFIIGILVGLPVLAFLTWFLLFRGNNDEDDESSDLKSPHNSANQT